MRKNRSQKNKGSKPDNIEVKGKLDSVNYKQNPNWYFKDAVQADVLSRIQMNAFGALSEIGDRKMPTVMAFYANPCPGVTEYEDELGDFSARGVNRAAQKLWYMLTCKSGRAAGYTKADVALLLLGMGSMIETYEFIRRAFGIAYTYNQRNRALPSMLYQAMGVDMDDYQRNAAVYLKRMNSLMAIMNQLPMPGNIAWFAKCQDIYQNIYMDYPSEMAQLFMICPSTAWVLEENDGFIGGSYLRTVDMCINHTNSSSSYSIPYGKNSNNHAVQYDRDGGMYGLGSRRTRNQRAFQLSRYIDVFEEQVNNLLFSSTFSNIYSDLLRAFDNGTLARWTFDYIDEKYMVTPVFDDNRLWMFHNASILGGILSNSREKFQESWNNAVVEDQIPLNLPLSWGTPCNDVYQHGGTDIVIYNPSVTVTMAGNQPTMVNSIVIPDVVVDFPNDAPTVEERIEYTRYISVPKSDFIEHPTYLGASTQPNTKCFAYNMLLPDHWFEYGNMFYGMDDVPDMIVDDPFNDIEMEYIVTRNQNHPFRYADLSKFHHGPLMDEFVGSTGGEYKLKDVFGELNAWTVVQRSWFSDINDMIYVDLFDIR